VVDVVPLTLVFEAGKKVHHREQHHPHHLWRLHHSTTDFLDSGIESYPSKCLILTTNRRILRMTRIRCFAIRKIRLIRSIRCSIRAFRMFSVLSVKNLTSKSSNPSTTSSTHQHHQPSPHHPPPLQKHLKKEGKITFFHWKNVTCEP